MFLSISFQAFLGTSILHATIILLYAEFYILPRSPHPSTVERASLWVVQNPHATILLLAVYSSRGNKVLIAQWCPTLCHPMNGSPPGNSVHGILQARILEWIAIPFSRGCSRPRDRNWVLPHCRQILCHLSHQES